MKKAFILLTCTSLLLSASDKNKPKPFTQNKTLTYTEFASPEEVTLKCYMVDGFIEGECRGYLKDDRSALVLIENYKKGKLDGQFIQYYPHSNRIYYVGLMRMDTLISGTMYDSIGYTYLSYYVYNGELLELSHSWEGTGIDFSVLDRGTKSYFYNYDTMTKQFKKVPY